MSTRPTLFSGSEQAHYRCASSRCVYILFYFSKSHDDMIAKGFLARCWGGLELSAFQNRFATPTSGLGRRLRTTDLGLLCLTWEIEALMAWSFRSYVDILFSFCTRCTGRYGHLHGVSCCGRWIKRVPLSSTVVFFST